jgi:gamma-glutamyltranspeptidase/glutathione hydrolase
VLSRLHATRGRLPLAALVRPAIRLARDGYPLTPIQRRLLVEYARPLRRAGAGALFLGEAGAIPPAGWLFRQPLLADTLERLAEAGLDDYYTGGIARAIDADMRSHGGFVRLADLEAAALVSEVEPLRGRLWDDEVLSAGPPAGGLALLQMLELASRLRELEREPDRPGWALAVAATIRRARRDRRRYRLRTGAEEPGQALELIEPERAEAAAREIESELDGAGETSHLIAADAEGNLVSMTQSIERSFGAGVAAGELGFLYNGYLRAFKLKNRGHPHHLRPGSPARSNAAPTLVLRDGRPRATLGSTGSERMLSGMFQVLLRLRHQEPFTAVAAPRLHATPDGRILWEEERFAPGARLALRRAGYRLESLDPWSFKTGGLQLAVFGDEGLATGVSEPRRDGSAAGPGSPARGDSRQVS